MTFDKCDKCHSDILMGECSCGKWFKREDVPKNMRIYRDAMEEFHRSGREILSNDHYSGCCSIYFKGDYKDCMNIVKLIEQYNEVKKLG